jgi:hypothetical protein
MEIPSVLRIYLAVSSLLTIALALWRSGSGLTRSRGGKFPPTDLGDLSSGASITFRGPVTSVPAGRGERTRNAISLFADIRRSSRLLPSSRFFPSAHFTAHCREIITGSEGTPGHGGSGRGARYPRIDFVPSSESECAGTGGVVQVKPRTPDRPAELP